MLNMETTAVHFQQHPSRSRESSATVAREKGQGNAEAYFHGLSAASYTSHEKVVLLLLENEANIDPNALL